MRRRALLGQHGEVRRAAWPRTEPSRARQTPRTPILASTRERVPTVQPSSSVPRRRSLACTTARIDLHRSHRLVSAVRSPVAGQGSRCRAGGSGATAKDGSAARQAGQLEGCHPTTRRTVGPSKQRTLDEPPIPRAPNEASVRPWGWVAHDARAQCPPTPESRGRTPYEQYCKRPCKTLAIGRNGATRARQSVHRCPPGY